MRLAHLAAAGLAAALLASATAALAGPCIPVGLGPSVLTPIGAKVGKGGGILVGTTSVPNGGSANDASIQPRWKLRIHGGLVDPLHATLAPGLTVYTLPGGAEAATLEDDNKTRQAEVTQDFKDTKVLGAPKIKAARWVVTPATPGPGAGAGTSVQVDLAAAPPASALALIVYGPDGTARDWVHVSASSKSFSISQSPFRCQPVVPGRQQVNNGDSVTFAYVDTSGRPSAMSPAITVGK